MKTITPDTTATAGPQHQQLQLQQQQQQQLPTQTASIPQQQPQQHITPVIMEATAHVNLVDDDDEKDPLALDATVPPTLSSEMSHQQQLLPVSSNKHTHSLRYVDCKLFVMFICQIIRLNS